MSDCIISGERTLTYPELQSRALKVAGGFSALGVREGDAIAFILRNDFVFFEAAMGSAIIGAYAVPINWHFKSKEVAYILDDCAAKLLIIHADLLPEIEVAIPPHVRILVVETPIEIRTAYGLDADACRVKQASQDWGLWRDEQEPWAKPPMAARTNIIYTSGTTGMPKGVVREPPTPEQTQRTTMIVGKVFGIKAGDEMRTVITGPIYHTAPNAYALIAMQMGGTIVLQPRFDEEDLLRLIEQHRITHLHMVPTMFVRLLKLPEDVRARYDLSSLDFVVHAAAPCPPDIKLQMIHWWGLCINEYYGATEIGPPIFHTAEEALRKPGTVGRLIDGAVAKIYSADGKELPVGEIGEIYVMVKGQTNFTYKNNEEKRRDVERDGLVTVGDIGYFDEDGYLFICDRANDMVISGGVNIYPKEIEGVLIGMPGVRDCAVFGIPDETYGESLCAHIELDAGAVVVAVEVSAWLAERLTKYKVPKTIVFTGSLPREDSGKIMKRKLREKYWQDAGRSI